MIDVEKLLRRMTDGSIAPPELAQYVELDPAHEREFDPRVRPRPDQLADADRDAEPLLHGWFNDYARYWRQRRFEALVERFDGIRIVSEGDSWFQYPIIRHDIIDHLLGRYAIYSLGRAGDTLQRIVEQQDQEIFPALADYEPHFFLISGGGNDMVGNGHLADLVGEYGPDREPQDYAATAAFDAFIKHLMGLYEDLFRRILDTHTELEIVFHGYDAPIPGDASDPYLGAPLIERGITHPQLQVRIMQAIMRRYNDELAALASRFPRVHHVDCMGSLQACHWGDSMHPTSRGALRPAARINRRLAGLARDRSLPLHLRPT